MTAAGVRELTLSSKAALAFARLVAWKLTFAQFSCQRHSPTRFWHCRSGIRGLKADAHQAERSRYSGVHAVDPTRFSKVDIEAVGGMRARHQLEQFAGGAMRHIRGGEFAAPSTAIDSIFS